MGSPFSLREISTYDPAVNGKTSWPDSTIFMQWSGLVDVNNNLIFEGDILKYHFEDDTHDYMPVFFKAGSFWTGKKDDELLFDDLDPKHGFRIEVAGNIYEHAHLLQP